MIETEATSYVLMLPRWYPNVKDPADGNFIEQHIRVISEKMKVQVLFVKGLEEISSKEIKSFQTTDQCHCLTVYYPLKKGWFGNIINPVNYFLAQLNAFKRIRTEKGMPELCHVHVMARSSLLANYLSILHNIPFIISEHWSGYFPESGKLNGLKKFLYRLLYRKASMVTAVSKSLADSIQRLPVKQKIKIIPNVVLDVFLESEREKSGNTKTLLHISNLINEIKQTDKIIIYLNELAAQRNDFELIIAGDGVDRANLEVLAMKSAYLKNRITFTGDIPADALETYIAKSTAVISFSKYETQSIVLLESIAAGIPVIAPRVGGIPEHCTGRGLLFEVDSKEEFLKCVNDVLDGITEFDRAEMKQYARKHFSSTKIAEEFFTLYQQVQK